MCRSEIVAGKARDVLHILDVPLALELQIVDGHDRLHPAVKVAAREALMQIHGNQGCLPVMAVNQIRAKTDHGQDGQRRFGEERKFLDLEQHVVAIGFKAVEIVFVIDKVIFDSVVFRFQDSHILVLPVELHVKVVTVMEHILLVLVHAVVLGQDHPHVVIFLIDAFRQGADHIRQAACFDKGHALRCHKQNLLHFVSSHIDVL